MQRLEEYLAAVTGRRSGLGERPQGLNVLMVYEDLETGVRARQALDEALHRLAADADVRVRMWRFDLLGEPASQQQAVNEASEGRIVFVSAHGSEELPAGVGSWFEQWLSSRSDKPCALVISIDVAAANTPTANQITHTLGTAARLAGMAVFLHFGDVQTEAESVPTSTRIPAAQADDVIALMQEARSPA
jgi:hypothetical protein